MSNAKKYIVSIAVDGVVASQLWDSSRSQRLGYAMPWKLIRQSGETIEIRHERGQRLVFSASDLTASRELSLPIVNHRPRVPVHVRVSEVEELAPAFV